MSAATGTPPATVATPEPPVRRRRIRRGVLGAAVAAVVLGAAVVTVAGFGGGFGDQETATADTLPPATATVTRQTLTDTETADGELGYGSTRTATAKAGGTVTALARAGATVARGKALYRIDNRPVVLLYGTLPAYRTLSAGVEGRDVEQLEKNLAALGYDGFTVDREYTGATAEAVEQWQDDLGLTRTGRVEPGRIRYASGAVRVESHSVEVGATVQPGAAVLTYTGSERVVTVQLDVDDQRLAAKGATVTVTLPDRTSTKGKISAVETVIQTSSGAGGEQDAETKIEVTVAADDDKALSGYDAASVDVAFTAARREDVLTVPVAALLALAEGGYGVEVVDDTGTRIVAVETGLFAAGRVEVSGDGLAEGLTVGVPA
mgnify:CR=1 FL=1